jgi:hypothetical protein
MKDPVKEEFETKFLTVDEFLTQFPDFKRKNVEFLTPNLTFLWNSVIITIIEPPKITKKP